jgi:hypothetical protein
MNSRWAAVIAASLVAFASFVITWQIRHYNDVRDFYPSVSLSLLRGQQLAAISDISQRDSQSTTASGHDRNLDLVLPKDARVFMTDMTGPNKFAMHGQYFWMTYYLFPREVGTSLDHITHYTKDGFLGKTSESDQEILAHGFDVRMDITSDGGNTRPLGNLSLREPVNPDWFDERAVAEMRG